MPRVCTTLACGATFGLGGCAGSGALAPCRK